MTTKKSGEKISLYFDKHLWHSIDVQSHKLNMTPSEFIRHAVKMHLQDETTEEVEKLQLLNTRMFKFIANKLSHVEMLSAIAKEKSNEMNSGSYERSLKEIKEFNQKKAKEIIEESL